MRLKINKYVCYRYESKIKGGKVKILTVIVASLVILVSCGEQTVTDEVSQISETIADTEALTEKDSEPETSETEAVSEISVKAEKPSFVNNDAENFYDIIMSDMSWRKDDATGAILIDLQGDGTPEFLVDRWNRIRDCYRFDGDKLEYINTYDWGDGLLKYVEDGKTYWWGSTYSYERIGESNTRFESHHQEKSYGLMKFTDNGLEMEKVIFYRTEDYDGITDIYEGELFINGEKYAEDHIEDYAALDGVPPMYYFGWKAEKEDWENENLTRYYFIPQLSFWEEDTDVSSDIAEIANTYCGEN